MLGVPVEATPAQIRSAYRRLVLQHHPDRSKSSGSPGIFIQVTEAYRVLADQHLRRQYDESSKRASRPSAKTETATREKPSQRAAVNTTGIDLGKLVSLFNKGRTSEAEALARHLVEREPREAIPYAILGDIHRGRGDFKIAQKFYSYALQMDPKNESYFEKHEEVASLGISAENPTNLVAPTAGAILAVLCAIYIVLGKEPPIFPSIGLISSFSIGLIVMLFLSGFFVGASLTVGGYLDRVSASTTGVAPPKIIVGLVSLVSFLAAVVIYLMVGICQQSFNYSASRLIAAASAVLFIMTLAASFSGYLESGQVLLWGGNIIYIGALFGWLSADSMRT